MNHMKKSMNRVFIFIFVLFISLSAYLIKIMTTDRERISTNSYNPRLGFYDENVKRGTIYDANMTPLAYSVFNGSEYERKYPFGSLASHIIGYRSAGRSGIEATENYRLENVSDQLKQRIMYVTKKDEILADGVVLTIDVALQKRLDAALGTNKGAPSLWSRLQEEFWQ